MIKLREHQEKISTDANEKLKELGIVYLSLEVRTGKTLTSLATAQKYGAKKVLFVTKKKAIGSIQSDYDLFNPNFQIIIINYESLHKLQSEPDFVIIDEAHSIGAFPKPSRAHTTIRD